MLFHLFLLLKHTPKRKNPIINSQSSDSKMSRSSFEPQDLGFVRSHWSPDIYHCENSYWSRNIMTQNLDTQHSPHCLLKFFFAYLHLFLWPFSANCQSLIAFHCPSSHSGWKARLFQSSSPCAQSFRCSLKLSFFSCQRLM